MLTRFLPLLFVFSTVSLPAQPGARTTFYVAPTGESTHPGTQARPFATPKQARLAIRKVRATRSEQACTGCGTPSVSYNSCRHRACPKCQWAAHPEHRQP